jgi:ketosteroid isomerase-like protein
MPVARASQKGKEAHEQMRTLLVGGALAVSVVSLAACGGSSTSSASEKALHEQADLYAIDQIEKNFHKATSKHDIDLMMSLWAPHATFTYGPGDTATGTKQIRHAFLHESKAFKPTSHWVSDTPAYKVRITVNGDRGTLNFECHYVDIKTGKVVSHTAADQEVARINGQWLITSMVGGSAPLTP